MQPHSIPQKSKDRYIKELEKFRSWMKNRNVNVVSEEVMLISMD
jgi:hypothetical protein